MPRFCCPNSKSLSVGVILPPGGQLAVTGDIFTCHRAGAGQGGR